MRHKGAIPPVLAVISILIAIAGRENCVVVSIAIAALVLCIIAVIAPFTPVLRRLPFIGEPKLKAMFALEPGNNSKISVPPGEEPKAKLVVGIKNPHRHDIKNASFTLLIPASIVQYEALDKHGNPNGNEGVWSTTIEKDTELVYWNRVNVTFRGRHSSLLKFEVTFPEAGTYGPIYCKIISEDLPRVFICSPVTLTWTPNT